MTIKLILVFALIPCWSLAKSSPDFSSVDAFWEISGRIKNESVTERDWNELFATPYYHFYEEWRQKKYIQKMMTLALSPSKKNGRDSALKINNWPSAIIRHLLAADSAKSKLQAFQQQLMKRDLMAEVLQRVQPFLPPTATYGKPTPVVAFGIFQPDGNADKIIAVDLHYAMNTDIIGFIAHEAHHIYTYDLRKKFKEDKRDSTYEILHAVGQLQLEGLADMVDKQEYIMRNGNGVNSQQFGMYKWNFENPAVNLQKVDSLLVVISRDPGSSKKNGLLIRGLLPMGGHPHGFFMAKTIGEKDLMKTLSNPFDFIRAYNEAAGKSGKFVFSNDSMNLLGRIESTHLVR